DTSDDGKQICLNCNRKFDTLPFEYNGKKYHSQQCADEARQIIKTKVIEDQTMTKCA
ncbi:1591_t:CDS:1, partial [Gigaspora margarita]